MTSRPYQQERADMSLDVPEDSSNFTELDQLAKTRGQGASISHSATVSETAGHVEGVLSLRVELHCKASV